MIPESPQNVDLLSTASSSTTSKVISEEDVFYTYVDGAWWLLEFKEILEETRMDETRQCALKIMNLLQLGKVEKLAYSME